MIASKPLVLLDVDGVIADFVGASLDAIERHMGIRFAADQVTSYDFRSLPGWDSIKDRFWELTRSIGFCQKIEPFPGAVEGVGRLREVATVEFLTSPMHGSPTWVHERDFWLERHFGAHHRDVMHVRKKERVRGDFLVDDSADKVESWRKAHLDGVGIVWTRPYNGGLEGPRVAGWDELLQMVDDRWYVARIPF